MIEEGTGREELLGLYEGISLKDRAQDYSGVMPDKITLFKKAIEAECRKKRSSLRREIKETICHEIAHHFGIGDERLTDLGIY